MKFFIKKSNPTRVWCIVVEKDNGIKQIIHVHSNYQFIKDVLISYNAGTRYYQEGSHGNNCSEGGSTWRYYFKE
jgi:hypothetical protein